MTKVIVKQVNGCQEGIMVVEENGSYYVGMEFTEIGARPFASSPAYKTIGGAERFARKWYR